MTAKPQHSTPIFVRVAVGDLDVEIGHKYTTSNVAFPIVTVLAIRPVTESVCYVCVSAPHPSLGHLCTADLVVDELIREVIP